jgi:serine/threonine-protein kinase RsbW
LWNSHRQPCFLAPRPGIGCPINLDFPAIHKQTAIIAAIRSRQSTGVDERTALPDSLPESPIGSKTSRDQFILDSSLASVDKIEQAAEGFAVRAGFDEDTVAHIAMAVREAAINAALHGNAYDPSKKITASFESNPDDLIIRIADQGPGLDHESIPDPLAPENILRGSGRGIFLIKAFMDEVHFRQLHPGTELTLIKHRAPAQPAG